MVPQEKKLINVCLSSFYLHLHEEEMIQVQMQLVPEKNFNFLITNDKIT